MKNYFNIQKKKYTEQIKGVILDQSKVIQNHSRTV